MNLFRTRTIEQSIADTQQSEHQLRKELGPVQLTVFRGGVIIGTLFAFVLVAIGVLALHRTRPYATPQPGAHHEQ